MQEKKSKPHLSVMPAEFLEYFSGCTITNYFEGTVGAGGHAKLILEAHPEIETYIGCDRDPLALDIAEEVLAPWKNKVHLYHNDFADLDHVLKEQKVKEVDGFFLT